MRVKSLGRRAATGARKIRYVRLAGSGEKVKWTVEDDFLRIARPNHKTSDLAIAFEIG